MADAWFRSVAVSPGVEKIWEPAVHPFFQANLYRISGRDRDIQLDFGTGVQSLPAFAPAGDKPLLAIASHVHIDHVGSFFEYADRAGHPLEAPFFADMRDDMAFGAMFRDHPEPLAVLPEGFVLADYRIGPAPLTRLLDEGDTVDLGDRLFTVLHLPGHSPGSIALLDERNGEFFAADAIYDGYLVDDVPGADIETYLRTMERLRTLDVSMVHAGHGESFGRQRMQEIAEGYLRKHGG